MAYSVMILVKFADLSQSEYSNWVMQLAKDPCLQLGWDVSGQGKTAFIKSINIFITLVNIWSQFLN